ncbi:LAMI_0B04258g1_1 [Lachancea mirantina]|uniref:Ubiquitin carboxyl-terminal hydrolase n=1 Tax=Lachancea mirantina TaxID=1230905 RepID=A0A1G4IVP0_9SACH|nr:LAMI_0B04258g1_1 [Lachancea mirantina]
MSWNTIESDAGVFTELVKNLGVQGVQFEDVPVLDDLTMMGCDLYGVVFLFQYNAEEYGRDKLSHGQYVTEYPDSLFFAQQTIQNACGTQAVLNALLSLSAENPQTIKLGNTLSTFLEFTSGFNDSALKGETISNSEEIRSVHNSFTSPDPFVMDENRPTPDSRNTSELFHFVAFIPCGGAIYELDGLRSSPIVYSDCGKDNGNPEIFAANVANILQKRIAADAAHGSAKFSVMAIIRDRLDALKDKLASGAIDEYTFQVQLNNELQKREGWKREIVMRRNNFYGLAFELLKQVTSDMTDDDFKKQVSKAQQSTQSKLGQFYQ